MIRDRRLESSNAPRLDLEALIERHEGELLRYAIFLGVDRDLAEDAVQEAFLALVRERRRGGEIASPSGWLFRVVRNRCRDSQRREMRVRQREAAVATIDRGHAEIDPLEQDERCDAVARLLEGLESETREVLCLSVIEGKSYREIAGIVGVSLGTVANRVHHGLSQISGGLRAAGVL